MANFNSVPDLEDARRHPDATNSSIAHISLWRYHDFMNVPLTVRRAGRPKTQHDFVRTALRLPRDLHAMVHEAAETDDRTFNEQLIHMVKHYLQASRRSNQ